MSIFQGNANESIKVQIQGVKKPHLGFISGAFAYSFHSISKIRKALAAQLPVFFRNTLG